MSCGVAYAILINLSCVLCQDLIGILMPIYIRMPQDANASAYAMRQELKASVYSSFRLVSSFPVLIRSGHN